MQALEVSMSIEEARSCTEAIRKNFQDARDNVLKIYQNQGWLPMGYESFQAWAQGEFKDLSWQQVYNLKSAAEIDSELALHSPEGEIMPIPVNHAKELRKLKTSEKRVRAYQQAKVMAKAQGKDEPTAKIVEDAVYTVGLEEQVEESPYPVVRQMFAEGSLSAPNAKEITAHLDRIGNEPAQAYVQSLMANYRLSSPDVILAIGLRYKSERANGKRSKVLDEIDRTQGYLLGTYLSKANIKDWERACKQAQEEHIAESEAAKRQQQLAAGIPIEEQFALTLWRNAPIKSVKELIRLLPPNDLEAVFHLLAKELGYVATDAYAQVLEDEDLIGVEFMLRQEGSFEAIEEGQDLQVMTRVKPKNEEKEGE